MSKLMDFTDTVLKNLFSSPVTTKYPEEPKVYPERTRGHVEIAMKDCLLCGLCAKNCPPCAITVDRKARTWSIERFDCVQCGYCTVSCPKKCLTIVPGYPEPGEVKRVDTYTKPEEEKPAAASANADAVPVSDTSVCVYCTLCAKKCPAGAITVDRAEKVWKLDESKCLHCGVCAQSCPKKCITMK